MSRPSATSPLLPQLLLLLRQGSAHRGRAATVDTEAVTRRCGSPGGINAIDQQGLLSAAGRPKRNSKSANCACRAGPLGLDGPLLQQPGHTAVHGAGVEVGEPQLASHLTGHRALTGTGWTIDGKDWQTAETR